MENNDKKLLSRTSIYLSQPKGKKAKSTQPDKDKSADESSLKAKSPKSTLSRTSIYLSQPKGKDL